MLEVIDGVLNLLEPGGTMDPETSLRVAMSGTTVDHTGARPFDLEFDPDRLYAWSGLDRHEVTESGDPPGQLERFTLNVFYAADSKSEQAKSRRERSVTEAIDTKAHAYLATIAEHQSHDLWSDLNGEANPSVGGFNVRGVGLRLTGWRHLQQGA